MGNEMKYADAWGYGVLISMFMLMFIPKEYIVIPVTMEQISILMVGSAICFSIGSLKKEDC